MVVQQREPLKRVIQKKRHMWRRLLKGIQFVPDAATVSAHSLEAVHNVRHLPVVEFETWSHYNVCILSADSPAVRVQPALMQMVGLISQIGAICDQKCRHHGTRAGWAIPRIMGISH